MNGKRWTQPELDFLRDNYLKMSLDEIAEHLGRTRSQTRSAASNHKIAGKRRLITDEEIEIVTRLYPDTDTAEIAKQIGRTVQAVYGMATNLGLKKTKEFTREYLAKCGRQFAETGKVHRFKKGQVPANKGLRRPGWHRGRMRETQFKKGECNGAARQLYQPIGTERLSKDGYRERKVNDDLPLQQRWKGVSRIVWEEANGPIPKGHNVAFIDRNKLNCSLENLELITKAENMRRNTFHNYPEPVRKQIHILAGFKRRLNNYAKKQDRRSA